MASQASLEPLVAPAKAELRRHQKLTVAEPGFDCLREQRRSGAFCKTP
jgi:hypothetical protein